MLKSCCLTFFDKEMYVVHNENLQLYLRLELKLKLYMCIIFQQITMTKNTCRI